MTPENTISEDRDDIISIRPSSAAFIINRWIKKQNLNLDNANVSKTSG